MCDGRSEKSRPARANTKSGTPIAQSEVVTEPWLLRKEPILQQNINRSARDPGYLPRLSTGYCITENAGRGAGTELHALSSTQMSSSTTSTSCLASESIREVPRETLETLLEPLLSIYSSIKNHEQKHQYHRYRME